jgi:hypothetical protein
LNERGTAVSLALYALCTLCGCVERDSAPGLAKERASRPRSLDPGQYWPRVAEARAVGAIERRVVRGGPGFTRLVRSDGDRIVFKDEEGTGADRLMSPEVRARLTELARLVRREWPALELRVTEAWDEDDEHGEDSLHYAGRAVDVTTSDVDPKRLGRLAGLAIETGFDWVYCERTHVHASQRE